MPSTSASAAEPVGQVIAGLFLAIDPDATIAVIILDHADTGIVSCALADDVASTFDFGHPLGGAAFGIGAAFFGMGTAFLCVLPHLFCTRATLS